MKKKFSHVDERGRASMVNVGDKKSSRRTASASAIVSMNEETYKLLYNNQIEKGDAISTARIAGIQAAKRTFDFIPLCHNIPISFVGIDFEFREDYKIEIISNIEVNYKTGAEMEALTAVSIAALTIYDMCKAVDKSITIESIKLLSKTGGKSGNWKRN